MTTEPEKVLEDNLITQLEELGYKYVEIRNEEELLANLKTQIEIHNGVKLTQDEFFLVLNHLNKGNSFERSKILRDKMSIKRDNGEVIYLEFIQQHKWCQNEYQVTRQVTMEGAYQNRYDVTLLINGLPLVQIELKRKGLELKEAFNQINRYQKHSFWASNGLFQYVQIFVISNGVNTKYFANNKSQSFKQTFYWSDVNNNRIGNLEDFAKVFLEKCFVSKMITKYIVLSETLKIPMVLRPYQVHAVEKIVEHVKTSHKNGYIWHTTGSGKTLTSFKASQVLVTIPKVDRVVFVVDRKDLDAQTSREFNTYRKDCVDETINTNKLVEQFNNGSELIVTTIQKLNNALKNRYEIKMKEHKKSRIIFIFDECHRSQFGDTHKNIRAYFENAQMFGFTGTPILAQNSIKNELGERTTVELFDECLHKYVITDAIKDENVLKFNVEYIGRYKEKEGSKKEVDIEVEDIDKKELLESPQRIEKIIDYIIANYDYKTHNKEYNAMLCVSNVETLIKYYDIFKKKKDEGKHNLKIATIFSFAPNEESKDADGFIGEEELEIKKTLPQNSYSREKLDEYITDYNKTFGTNYSTKDSKSFYDYYVNIAKTVRNGDVDILLVVNMFLTGFDAPRVNTLFVDKNLKYHGLIQAFSRTNRVVGEKKSQGNILCFRNLKKAVDDAIALFSNKDAKEVILMKEYEYYVNEFNEAVKKLRDIVPTVESVDQLKDEHEQIKFIVAFRNLLRLKNILITFTDFSWKDLDLSEQEFANYRSKYLDLFQSLRAEKEKESILNDVDFELELIHRDEINVAYIIKLLAKYKRSSTEEKEKQLKQLDDMLNGEPQLHKKRDLIKKFIEENLPHIEDESTIEIEFEKFWTIEQQNHFDKICNQEKLIPEKLKKVLSVYVFTERLPLRDDLIDCLEIKPKLLERLKIGDRILAEIKDFVEIYYDVK